MLKLVSWNIARRLEAWRALIDVDADIALLQEACEPPSDIASRFDVGVEPWRTEGADLSRPWRAAIVGLTKHVRLERIPTYSITDAGFSSSLCLVRERWQPLMQKTRTPTFELPGLDVRAVAASHSSTESRWKYADASAHRLVSDVSVLVDQEQGQRMYGRRPKHPLRSWRKRESRLGSGMIQNCGGAGAARVCRAAKRYASTPSRFNRNDDLSMGTYGGGVAPRRGLSKHSTPLRRLAALRRPCSSMYGSIGAFGPPGFARRPLNGRWDRNAIAG